MKNIMILNIMAWFFIAIIASIDFDIKSFIIWALVLSLTANTMASKKIEKRLAKNV